MIAEGGATAGLSSSAAGATGCASAPPKPRLPITLDALVREWAIVDRRLSRDVIRLGNLAYVWVRKQADRAASVRAIRQALHATGITGESARVCRFIGVYWVARLFSQPASTGVAGASGDTDQRCASVPVGATGFASASSLPVSTLRALIPLLKRDPATEQWEIRESCRASALALWARIVPEKLTSAAVAQVVQQLRPPKTPRKLKITRKMRVLKELRRLTLDDLGAVLAACHDEYERRRSAAA